MKRRSERVKEARLQRLAQLGANVVPISVGKPQVEKPKVGKQEKDTSDTSSLSWKFNAFLQQLPRLFVKIVLAMTACGIEYVILSNNSWFNATQASTDAKSIMSETGIIYDVLTFLLPTASSLLWKGRQYQALLPCICIYLFCLSYAGLTSLGFNSANYTETTIEKTEHLQEVVEAKNKIEALTKSRDAECVKRGPICHKIEDELLQARQEMPDVRKKAADKADPQTASAVKFTAWVTRGYLQPSANDLSMFKLLLPTILPLIGGIILWIAKLV